MVDKLSYIYLILIVITLFPFAVFSAPKDIHLCPGLTGVEQAGRTVAAVKPCESNPKPALPPFRCEDKIKRVEDPDQPGYYLLLKHLRVLSNGEEATGPHAPLGNLQIKLFRPEAIGGLGLEGLVNAIAPRPS